MEVSQLLALYDLTGWYKPKARYKPKTTRSSVMTQLMPELVARHFDAGSSEQGNNGRDIVIVLTLLLLGAACTFGLTRLWCTWRGYLRERDQIELEEPYDDDDAVDRVDSLSCESGAQFTLDDDDDDDDDDNDDVTVSLRSDGSPIMSLRSTGTRGEY